MAKQVGDRRDILLITLGFPPARGGIQSCLFARARLTPERIVVLAPDMPGAGEFDREQSFPIHRWPAIFGQTPGVKRFSQLLFSLIFAWRLCKEYRIRHIECGQGLPFGVAAWWLRICKGIPYRIWTYGDDVVKPAHWRLIRPLLVNILQRAETVLAISEFTRAQVCALGVSPKTVRVIYPVLASAQPPSHATSDAGGKATLLTVARLEARKGIHLIIEMLPALREKHPDLRYVVAGDGPAKASLESLARQINVTEAVQFAGDVSENQLAALYASCDLFVMLPTPAEQDGEVEGFGMVYLEAAASGRPSVAWDTGGVAEAVIHMHTGLVVRKDDLMAAQEAILTLLNDHALRAKLGQEARNWATGMRQRSARAIRELGSNNGSS